MRRAASLLALLLPALVVALASSPQPSGSTLYVNNADSTCRGQGPCYAGIQAAVSAAQPADTIVIQPGTYPERVIIQGKNNFAGAGEAHRIVIEADPDAPAGSVLLAEASQQCTNGEAIRLQQSRFVTLRGLTITRAGGPAIMLLGGINQNQAIHIERNRIVDNGGALCHGGIVVALGNPGTLIANNLVHANGRNGITFLDADGGPHYIVNNTIHANDWNGVEVARNHEVFLVNNVITQNGAAAGSTGGRFGVKREAATVPRREGIHLLNNLICGNRLGEISGPVLDATDSANLTPTGTEGPGVGASPGCQVAATIFANLTGRDGLPDTSDDDFTLAPASTAIGRGIDPRTLGLGALLDPILEADFAREGVRPSVATPTRGPGFDLGAFQLTDEQPPGIEILEPSDGAWARGTIALRALATDSGSGVASISFAVDAQAIASAANADPTQPFTASASLDTRPLGDGLHTLKAIAADRAGRSASVTQSLVVDNTPPDTRITAGPSAIIATSEASFTFTGSDNLTPADGLLFAWRVDGGAFSAFTPATTVSLTDLAEGPHTFEVKARDRAGNEDPAPAVSSFAVSPGPLISGVVPPSGTAGTMVTITGERFEPGRSVVAFNGVVAFLRSMSATTISTTVPLGATSGPLTVTTPLGTGSHDFTVTSTGDFSLSAAPDEAIAPQGGQTSYAVMVSGSGSFTGLVSLSVSELPSGLEATVMPAVLAPGRPGTLTLRAGADAPVGTWSLTLTGVASIDGISETRAIPLRVGILAGGRTALGGQFLTVDGAPLANVALRLEAARTQTDAGGNFLLLDVPGGPQQLMIDANAARAGLPIYAVEVTLAAGQSTTLPAFQLTPPPPPERFTPFGDTSRDQVITDPRFPGVEVTLPAGVTITGWDGQPKTRMAIERLSPDTLPVPPPPGRTRSLYQLYFGTPMGGIPSAPLPISLPNDQSLAPGDKADLWYYDASPLGGTAGWRLAGQGTVSADGSKIVSDPGVGIARFCGVCGLACFIARQTGQPNRNPDGPRVGEPVDLALGQMIVEKTDLILPARLPAILHRTYNPFDAFGAIAGFELGLGPGWALSVDVALQEESPTLRRVILPGNARFAFVRQGDGSFVNATHPRFAGAVLTQTGSTHTLRLKDGATWRFASGWRSRPTLKLLAGLGLLVEQADRNGNRLFIEREFSGVPTRIVEPAGRTLVLTVDGSGRISQATDPLGRVVRYSYDSARRLSTVADPAGGLTRYTYDGAGRILTITDPRGIMFVSHEYDTQGRVARQIQADGGEWTFQYSGPVGAHTSVTVTDPRGHATLYRLGPDGFPIETVDALGQSRRLDRNARGQVVAATDPLGRVTRFEYDGAGNLTRVIDPAGNASTLTYESTFARVTSITDPLGQATGFEYDPAGNLVAVVDPLGTRTTFAFDGTGQPVSLTDPLGNTTTVDYDSVGNPVSITDPLGNGTIRAYDAVSRPVARTDPRGRTTRFAYDALDQLETITDPAGEVTRIGYDANGNVLTVTDARGNTIAHAYDEMDRLTSRTDPLGAVKSFGYDGMGNPVRHVDRSGGVETFSYDALNRRQSASYADGSVRRFVYDAAGRLVETTDSAGGTIVRQYDLLGRLAAETTASGTIAYGYDALGRRLRMDAPGQPNALYGYDAASRLTRIAQGAQVVELQYDQAGRRALLALPNGVSTEYQYDAASRLTALSYRSALGPLGDLTYGYDGAGNRVGIGGSLARTSLPDPVDSATYDAANRQLQFGDKTLTYDANGNLTSITESSATTTFTWDARNRLVGVDGPVATASFGYDALGRRTMKLINGTETQQTYDGLEIVEELADGTPATYLRGLALDEPLVRNGDEFYLSDGLGSVLALTDPSGAIATRYVYDPFGRTGLEGAISPNPFQYTARENDGVAGLYWYRSRPYAPQLHRFLAEDPIGLLGGLNLYRYVFNSPISYRDPFGLDVTLYYYKAHFSEQVAFPHAAIQVNDGPVYGFYPQHQYRGIGAVLGRVPGDLRVDRDLADLASDHYTIETIAEQDEIILEVLLDILSRQALGRGDPYNALAVGARNCVTLVAYTLRQAGIQVPDFVSPGGLIPHLRSILGRGRSGFVNSPP